MGSEELDMVGGGGGGSSQRVDIGLNPMSGRSLSSEHYSRALPVPKRSEPAKKPRLGEGFGDYTDPKLFGKDRPEFLHSTERDFRGGEGFHFEHRGQKESGADGDERVKHIYGGSQIAVIGREQEWGAGERDGVVGDEADYREMGVVRGEASEASQSEGTEEEDDEDGDIEGEVDGGSTGDRGREGVVEDRPLPHPHLSSLESRVRQESMMPLREGFQRPTSDRDRGMRAPSSTTPFGMFLSPSPTTFLNYASSSPSGTQVTPHPEPNTTQNGGGGGGSSMPGCYNVREGGISRDSYAKSLVARENAIGNSMHEQPNLGQLHESVPSSDDNYYTSLLISSGSNNNVQRGQDLGNDGSCAGQKRNPRMAESPVAAEPSLRLILSDPLTGQLMEDATIFACGHSFGNAGLRRVIETNVCITCGASVRSTSMAPNHALRAAVAAYKREEEPSTSQKSAKKRRDRPDQDQVIPVEQQLPSDGNKAKGVQFPFSVSDRVTIKGNKRTPERFVGREAIITNQCLNGWYLVRTLDGEESVRLQYRSLQRAGGQPSPNTSHSGPGWL